MPFETFEAARGDREKVVLFVEALRQAFEDYVNAEAEKGEAYQVRWSDALMAVHNFHKLIILDIEKRSGMGTQPKEAQHIFRKMWVDTFRMALIGTDEEKEMIRAKDQS